MSGPLAWWLFIAALSLGLYLTRRLALGYLWRSFHLIEDLVIEKEFLHKIDVSIKLLLLILFICPAMQFI
ncbi:hypothetical protein, partial [Escherichia coli]|uniref:hypothetical protein n=1 Tax=Escherichia coli TaxID=562 RepID=UPI0039E0E1A4